MNSQEHKENSIRFIDSGYNEKHIAEANRDIRFINSHYKVLFRIPDGESITVTDRNGKPESYLCRYIDDYHTQIGSDVFHICEFAELCERNGHTVEPAGKEKAKPAKSKEKER